MYATSDAHLVLTCEQLMLAPWVMRVATRSWLELVTAAMRGVRPSWESEGGREGREGRGGRERGREGERRITTSYRLQN